MIRFNNNLKVYLSNQTAKTKQFNWILSGIVDDDTREALSFGYLCAGFNLHGRQPVILIDNGWVQIKLMIEFESKWLGWALLSF